MAEVENNLAAKSCVPCEGGVPPLSRVAQKALLTQLSDDWSIIEGHHLEGEYRFPDFLEGLAFVNAVSDIAESEGHHPDLHLSWGAVRVTIWTHAIDGLTESDFVLAAKIAACFALREARAGDAG